MKKISLLFGTLVLLLCSFTWAAQVTKVSGKKVLIKLEGFSLTVGTNYYLLSSDGKKKAIVEIKQVKNDLALAEIKKGSAEVGYSVQATAGAQAKSTTEDPSDKSNTGKSAWSGGVLGGLSMNSFAMTVQSTTNTALKADATMKGTSFGVRGFVDYEYSPSITVRGFAGYEPFAVKGNALGTGSAKICDAGASEECTVSFTYLALGGEAHYNFMTGKTRAFAGLGYNFLMAMGKSVNVPNLDTSSSANQMITFIAGADIGLSKGSFIPLTFEYGMFPGSASVVASAMYLRAGYGMSF